MKLSLGKLLGRPPGPLVRRYAVGEGERRGAFLEEMEAAGGGTGGAGKKSRRRGSGPGVWNIESRRRPCSAALRPDGGAAPRSGSHGGVGAPPAEAGTREPPARSASRRPARLGSARLLPAAQSASSEERERASGREGGGAGAAAARARRSPGGRGASCSCAPPRARPRRASFPPTGVGLDEEGG